MKAPLPKVEHTDKSLAQFYNNGYRLHRIALLHGILYFLGK